MVRFIGLLAVAVLLPGCGPTAVTSVPSAPPPGQELANAERSLANGSYEAAIGWLDGAIEKDPKNAAAYRLRAKANFAKAEKLEMPKGFGAEKIVETPAKLLESSIADATKAIELDPKDAEAYLLRAKARQRQGSDKAKEQAAADCDKAVELAGEGAVGAEAQKLREGLRGK